MRRRSAARPRQVAWPWVLTAFSLAMLITRIYAEFLAPGDALIWLRSWGFIPAEINAAFARPLSEGVNSELIGLFTALFVHGDWTHLAGNLAYLWVFGITVERALGHWGMAATFLLLGGLANFCLAWQMGDSSIPVIGASGGVSAIIGIYLGLFPVNRMGLYLPLGLYLQFARVPAILVIGSWFTLQLVYTVFGLASGAVAWWAHVAGFIAGVVVALLLRPIPGLINLRRQDD